MRHCEDEGSLGLEVKLYHIHEHNSKYLVFSVSFFLDHMINVLRVFPC